MSWKKEREKGEEREWWGGFTSTGWWMERELEENESKQASKHWNLEFRIWSSNGKRIVEFRDVVLFDFSEKEESSLDWKSGYVVPYSVKRNLNDSFESILFTKLPYMNILLRSHTVRLYPKASITFHNNFLKLHQNWDSGRWRFDSFHLQSFFTVNFYPTYINLPLKNTSFPSKMLCHLQRSSPSLKLLTHKPAMEYVNTKTTYQQQAITSLSTTLNIVGCSHMVPNKLTFTNQHHLESSTLLEHKLSRTSHNKETHSRQKTVASPMCQRKTSTSSFDFFWLFLLETRYYFHWPQTLN